MSKFNGVDHAAFREADGHGRAALLLVESLIHALAERSLLSVPEAVEIMEIALEAQLAISDEAQPPSAAMEHAAALLASLVTSLQADARD